MQTVYHHALSRRNVDHGWLNANHSFSFANYYNPERMNFDALRVLNDDTIATGMGFGTHPYENMEIITIPLTGDLKHKDSMGNIGTINEGEIQVMSAGIGEYHSEYNNNCDNPINLIQLWVFPNKHDVETRYDQKSLRKFKKNNNFYKMLYPDKDNDAVWIHQDAWFHLGDFEEPTVIEHEIKKEGNSLYVFVIEGGFKVGGQELNKRDAFGVWDRQKICFISQPSSKVLLVKAPKSY